MVAHHHSIFQKEEIWAPSEFFNFCQRPGWRSRCSDWNKLGEFELIFLTGVLTILGTFAVDLTIKIKKGLGLEKIES